MKKLDYLTKVIEAIVAVLMAGITILTFVQVARRFLFGAVFPWAEELAIYGMIWVTFFGSVLCLRHSEHTRIDAFLLVLPHKIRKWVEAIDLVICFAFMTYLAYHSIGLLKMTGKLLSTAARLPMYYVYSALLVSGVLMIPYFIILIYQKVREKEEPKAPSTTDD